MLLSGILWIVFGVFVMLDPWGAAEIYRPDLGYAVITDRALHLLYGIPGTAALVLSGFGLVTLAPAQAGRLVTFGRFFGYAAVGAGVLSGVGLAIGSAALFTGPVAMGTPILLGAAACFVATDVRSADRGLLLLIGGLGVFFLALWPLVFALQVIPPAGGAAVIAVFGSGWVILGWRAMRRARPANQGMAAEA